MGELLVVAYLKVVEQCDVVAYNQRPPLPAASSWRDGGQKATGVGPQPSGRGYRRDGPERGSGPFSQALTDSARELIPPNALI